MSHHIVEVADLRYAYPDGTPALQGVSFSKNPRRVGRDRRGERRGQVHAAAAPERDDPADVEDGPDRRRPDHQGHAQRGAAHRKLIEQLRSFQHTKIIASHDLDLVLDLCPRTIIVLQGKIAADGSPREVFCDLPLLKRCNLGQPLSWSRRGR